MRYLIFCDESVSKGSRFSNFYGGLIISSHEYNYVKTELDKLLSTLDKDGELKWSKVNAFNLHEYMLITDKFFDFVQEGVIKLRIMFTDNRFRPKILTEYQREHH